MARSQGTAVEQNFSAGFITEATGLNFPPNALTEASNVIPLQTGPVERRLGIDIEANYSTRTDLNKTGAAIVSYLWENVAGSATTRLLVLQVGSEIVFYDASSTDPLSANPIAGSIDLDDFTPSGFDSPVNTECQFADGNGLLFVVHPDLEAFRVSYDSNTETFTTTQIDLKIRDLEGVDDGYEIDERPEIDLASASFEKKYNLYNQGWETTPLASWDSARDDLPSNADVQWNYKDASNDFQTSLINKFWRGNSPAPKGHYILDLYNQDRATASGLTINPVEIAARASAVAFYAGRVFYGGIQYEGYNSHIYFTQIIERDNQYGACYQLNDPTSEIMFDLLPSDGGFISIRECGNIIKMAAIGQGLVVFATNGVWLVSGSTGLGFTANDYSVVKIAETPSISASSFVEVRGTMTWWNLDGIHTLNMEGNGGKTQSLTEPKIKAYYNTIPPSAKRRASGYFNGITGIIQWLYREEDAGTTTEVYEATHILNFNTNTGAFYIWTPAQADVKIHSCVVLEHEGGEIVEELIFDIDGEVIENNGGEDIGVILLVDGAVTPKFKYIVSYETGEAPGITTYFTVAEAWDTDYVDWATRLGTGYSYDSYFVTGHSIRGEGNKAFQTNYITLYSDNDSVFDVQGLWEFSNSGNSNKWSVSQRIDTTSKTYFDTVMSKRVIRGQGKSLRIKISSAEGEPFHVVGWVSYITGNSGI